MCFFSQDGHWISQATYGLLFIFQIFLSYEVTLLKGNIMTFICMNACGDKFNYFCVVQHRLSTHYIHVIELSHWLNTSVYEVIQPWFTSPKAVKSSLFVWSQVILVIAYENMNMALPLLLLQFTVLAYSLLIFVSCLTL